jgi:hypothetical protein
MGFDITSIELQATLCCHMQSSGLLFRRVRIFSFEASTNTIGLTGTPLEYSIPLQAELLCEAEATLCVKCDSVSSSTMEAELWPFHHDARKTTLNYETGHRSKQIQFNLRCNILCCFWVTIPCNVGCSVSEEYTASIMRIEGRNSQKN